MMDIFTKLASSEVPEPGPNILNHLLPNLYSGTPCPKKVEGVYYVHSGSTNRENDDEVRPWTKKSPRPFRSLGINLQMERDRATGISFERSELGQQGRSTRIEGSRSRKKSFQGHDSRSLVSKQNSVEMGQQKGVWWGHRQKGKRGQGQGTKQMGRYHKDGTVGNLKFQSSIPLLETPNVESKKISPETVSPFPDVSDFSGSGARPKEETGSCAKLEEASNTGAELDEPAVSAMGVGSGTGELNEATCVEEKPKETTLFSAICDDAISSATKSKEAATPAALELTIAHIALSDPRTGQSPLTGGNLLETPRMLKDPRSGQALSPPSSSSTMSSTNLQYRLTEIASESKAPLLPRSLPVSALGGDSVLESAASFDNGLLSDLASMLTTEGSSKNALASLPLSKKEHCPGAVYSDTCQAPTDVLLTEALPLSELSRAEFQMSIKSVDPSFAPVDVTATPSCVFTTSQVSNNVTVFKGAVQEGVLRINGRKTFDAPHNILYIPPIVWMDTSCVGTKYNSTCGSSDVDEPRSSGSNNNDPKKCAGMCGEHSLEGGCIVILDNVGFHVFANNGSYIKTFLHGLGFKFRGLALHVRQKKETTSYHGKGDDLYLVTMDISSKDATFVCLIHLKYVLLTNHQLDEEMIERIVIAPTRKADRPVDETVKCRFVATNFSQRLLMEESKKDEKSVAYVSAMRSKQIFIIDLETKESSVLNLYVQIPRSIDHEEESSMDDGTFVENILTGISQVKQTFLVTDVNDLVQLKKKPMVFGQPTGILFDSMSGLLVVADRSKNSLEMFKACTGEFLGTLIGPKTSNDEDYLLEPVGIHLTEGKRLYVASNGTRTVKMYQILS